MIKVGNQKKTETKKKRTNISPETKKTKNNRTNISPETKKKKTKKIGLINPQKPGKKKTKKQKKHAPSVWRPSPWSVFFFVDISRNQKKNKKNKKNRTNMILCVCACVIIYDPAVSVQQGM